MKDFGIARVSLRGHNIYSATDTTISGLYSELSIAYDSGCPVLITDITDGDASLPPVFASLEKNAVIIEDSSHNYTEMAVIGLVFNTISEGPIMISVRADDTVKAFETFMED